MNHIRVHRFVGDTALGRIPAVHVCRLVVDGVLGIKEITAGKTLLFTLCLLSRDSEVREEVRGLAVTDNFQRASLSAVTSFRLELAGKPRQRSRRSSDWWRLWCEADSDLVGIVTREVAREVGGLVQVDPERVNVDTILRAEEQFKFVGL